MKQISKKDIEEVAEIFKRTNEKDHLAGDRRSMIVRSDLAPAFMKSLTEQDSNPSKFELTDGTIHIEYDA